MITQGKTPSESLTTTTNIVFPDDTNPLGILYGGRILEWLDTASAICAQLHTGMVCVTVAIDSVQFKAPAKLGEIVKVTARITRTFRSSIEVLAEAATLHLKDGTRTLITTAYFTFVAMDEHGQRSDAFAPVIPENAEELRLYELALQRRQSG
jgi:acyl-CoA hydrolase